MTVQGWLLILVFTGLVIAMTKPFGLALFATMEGRRGWLHPVLAPVERGFYAASGIDPDARQGWRTYGVHILQPKPELRRSEKIALFHHVVSCLAYGPGAADTPTGYGGENMTQDAATAKAVNGSEQRQKPSW